VHSLTVNAYDLTDSLSQYYYCPFGWNLFIAPTDGSLDGSDSCLSLSFLALNNFFSWWIHCHGAVSNITFMYEYRKVKGFTHFSRPRFARWSKGGHLTWSFYFSTPLRSSVFSVWFWPSPSPLPHHATLYLSISYWSPPFTLGVSCLCALKLSV